ncbi:MAG: hypothetical protein JSR91_04975 [Proteobacteria bacterium]|nr:hypothetical protein [Pseudomonadota bacterium]
MSSDRLRDLAARGIDEFRRFLLMFVYLWVVFGLFVLNEAVILGKADVSFIPQGFAFINAAILAKVMLVAESLKLGRRFDHLPMIYPITYKSALFAIVFIAFHVLEETAVGMLAGRSAAASVPVIGGGTWIGLGCVWAIMAVSLLPFFALREISQILGEGQLWSLMFHRGPKIAGVNSRSE